jgi:arylsulfatase
MIANLDENLGELDIFLKKRGMYDNTILIFMTDNGGTGGTGVFNAAMRGAKGTLYEGGHRVPFFIRWPNGNFLPAQDIDVLAHSQDILPTLIDLCQLNHNKLQFDGVSLTDVIRGNINKIPDRILVMQNAKAPMVKKYDATVMINEWRLVKNDELFNIALDPKQKLNVADANPELVKKMQNHYEAWWDGVQESLNRVPFIPVGGENCSNITLTCFDWHGFEGTGNVTTQPNIRLGIPAHGHWNVEVLNDGTYEIRCSRWPREAKMPMTSGLPAHPTLTETYPEGKALSIASTKIQLDDQTETVLVNDSDQYSSAEFNLKKGKYTLKGIFYDKNGTLVCGAYYANIKRIK